jgi:hypothetical protein
MSRYLQFYVVKNYNQSAILTSIVFYWYKNNMKNTTKVVLIVMIAAVADASEVGAMGTVKYVTEQEKYICETQPIFILLPKSHNLALQVKIEKDNSVQIGEIRMLMKSKKASQIKKGEKKFICEIKDAVTVTGINIFHNVVKAIEKQSCWTTSDIYVRVLVSILDVAKWNTRLCAVDRATADGDPEQLSCINWLIKEQGLKFAAQEFEKTLKPSIISELEKVRPGGVPLDDFAKQI